MCDHTYIGLRPTGKPGITLCPLCKKHILCPHPFHMLHRVSNGVECEACAEVISEKKKSFVFQFQPPRYY